MLTLRAKTTIPALLAFAVAGCDGLLDVDLPGYVSEADLAAVDAQTLAQSIVGNVGSAWDDYVHWASNHSDEWMPASGNAPTKRMGLRRIDPNFDHYASNLFTPLHQSRAEANEFFDLIDGQSAGDVPDKGMFVVSI